MKFKIKQKNVPYLGALVDSLYTSLPILSIINFLSIITILYATIHEYLLGWAPWLSLWIFVGLLGIATTSTMVLIYIFVLPSVWTFRNKQMFGYESKVIDLLEKLEKMLEEKEVKK